MTAPSDALRAYLRYLKSDNPTQKTRLRWCDIHAALQAGADALDIQQPQEAEGELGYCCYGGMKLKGQCASCAAWKPQPGARVPDARLRIALESAFDDGFSASAEGANGEYGSDYSESPAYKAEKETAINEALAYLGQQPAQGDGRAAQAAMELATAIRSGVPMGDGKHYFTKRGMDHVETKIAALLEALAAQPGGADRG